jgi:two-component system alkaline phosphatase synthesis response regulator PhoP
LSKGHILAVDDEADILELIRYTLNREGYEVQTAESGEQALKSIRSRTPDALILDIMMPEMDGLDLCRVIRNSSDVAHLPIIMLTARSDEADMVTGLELGADDYIVKPFSPRVLTARLKAVLRRKKVMNDTDAIQYGPLLIQPEKHVVKVDDKPVELTATEYRILHLLARRPGWVHSRDQIVESVRGMDTAVTSRSVDVHIVSLRRKLAPLDDCIETVRGVGYRFREPDDA